MTKRQLRKAAYTAIFKEGKSHSDVFLTLRKKTTIDGNTLADIISGVPSRERMQSTKAVWMSYVGVLGIVVLMRLFYVILLAQQLDPNAITYVLLPIIAFSIFVPAGGIFAGFTGRRNMLPGVAIFLSMGILRGIQYSDLNFRWDSYLMFALVAALIVLTFLLWTKWKTPYAMKVKTVTTDKGEEKEIQYHFSDPDRGNAEVLDDL